ncbi:M24 family metallopeptidase [Desulfitibacter alkalitolerans]|uniref:M24 family metallopeptidase n=1 Tax=Desulfitibacter alkalitolerans TaxID=264641 RepID=UPI0004878959|nr:aminopeptidase P family protein [Desulfitibacter alkalitolerans]
MKHRIDKVRAYLEEKDMDAFLIMKPQNIRYLSGFTGSNCQLIITRSKNFLITDFRYIEQAKEHSHNYQVLKQEKKMIDVVKDICLQERIKQIAFEEDQMVYKMYETYYQALKPIYFIPSSEFLTQIRAIKDYEEITLLKKAVSFADQAFEHILPFIKPGIKEKDIALELEFFLRKKGADAKSFDYIVASGKRGALPHGIASDKKIALGELVTMDFGCIYEGYCSDITRTVCVGKIENKQREIYDIVLEAQTVGVNSLSANMKCQAADSIAREIIVKAGYGEYFGHCLGHGVGLEVHEEPRLTKDNESLLQPGMVVTVEPGVYIPGFGGVRIEDMVLIHKNHKEILTKSYKELLII